MLHLHPSLCLNTHHRTHRNPDQRHLHHCSLNPTLVSLEEQCGLKRGGCGDGFHRRPYLVFSTSSSSVFRYRWVLVFGYLICVEDEFQVNIGFPNHMTYDRDCSKVWITSKSNGWELRIWKNTSKRQGNNSYSKLAGIKALSDVLNVHEITQNLLRPCLVDRRKVKEN